MRSDDIVADYARTGENMAAIMERNRPVMGAMWKALGIDIDAFDGRTLMEGSMEVSMRMLLSTLRARPATPRAAARGRPRATPSPAARRALA